MGKVTVSEKLCKGCGLCVTACPRKIMALDEGKINEAGYHPAHVIDEEKCTACAMCALMCPDVAIVVEK